MNKKSFIWGTLIGVIILGWIYYVVGTQIIFSNLPLAIASVLVPDAVPTYLGIKKKYTSHKFPQAFFWSVGWVVIVIIHTILIWINMKSTLQTHQLFWWAEKAWVSGGILFLIRVVPQGVLQVWKPWSKN